MSLVLASKAARSTERFHRSSMYQWPGRSAAAKQCIVFGFHMAAGSRSESGSELDPESEPAADHDIESDTDPGHVIDRDAIVCSSRDSIDCIRGHGMTNGAHMPLGSPICVRHDLHLVRLRLS